PLMVAAGGPKSVELAAALGDGLIGVDPDRKLVRGFRKAGGARKPCYGELTVCWGKDEGKARRMAKERWPIPAMDASLAWERRLPRHFEAVAELVTEDAIAASIVCGFRAPAPSGSVARVRRRGLRPRLRPSGWTRSGGLHGILPERDHSPAQGPPQEGGLNAWHGECLHVGKRRTMQCRSQEWCSGGKS